MYLGVSPTEISGANIWVDMYKIVLAFTLEAELEDWVISLALGLQNLAPI